MDRPEGEARVHRATVRSALTDSSITEVETRNHSFRISGRGRLGPSYARRLHRNHVLAESRVHIKKTDNRRGTPAGRRIEKWNQYLVPPRVSRETRLLLIAGGAAIAMLWLLARIRPFGRHRFS